VRIRLTAPSAAPAEGVAIYGIEADTGAPRLVHEPGNPLADEQGFVSYPAVDPTQEMISMIKTQRAYESNIVAMGAARQMYLKALEIGRRS
jgi:flagellar basal-body rod protein FlgC